MRKAGSLFVAAMALVGLASNSAAQNIPRISLKPADATIDEEFTAISSVRELRDGRVIITDPRDKGMVVVDFKSGTIEPIGRKGDGPGEYRMAGPVRALTGDSSVMVDLTARRWLMLDGSKIAATLPPDAPVIVATRGNAIGADAAGFVISNAPLKPLTERAGNYSLGKGDSTLLVRVQRATGRADTLARLRVAPTQINATANAKGEVQSINVRRMPLAPGEEAFLFTDSWLAIARLEPYRVDWRSPDGRWILGPALPFPVVKLDQHEKLAHMERLAKASGRSTRPPETIADWPETMPPFATGTPLLGSPDGRLVVWRQATADHPETRYDVVNRRGVLEAQIVLPPNEHIAGFGTGSVYVVVRDADDIEHLRRHPWIAARP